MDIRNRGGKAIEKKRVKINNLFDAAYELFTTKGVHETAIDDIVKKAGIAKGTFYLYFKDKYDIIDRIVLKKSYEVLSEAMEATLKNGPGDFMGRIIYLIDYIVDYFVQNKIMLKLIYKNLSWGLYRKALADPNEYEGMQQLYKVISKDIKENIKEDKDVEKTLFMVIELTGAVIYSSIILGEPDDIDNMKPALFKTIKSILMS